MIQLMIYYISYYIMHKLYIKIIIFNLYNL